MERRSAERAVARPSVTGGRAAVRAMLCLAAIVTGSAGCGSSPEPRVSPVRVEATHFLVEKADGGVATRDELVGAIVLARGAGGDGDGAMQQYRIDAVEPSIPGEEDSLWLYTFSVPHPETGEWENPCPPGPNGRRAGFPYPGSWSAGDHVASDDEFSITCTAGTVGKCILMGYVPWERHESGRSLRDYHQRCVRMLRADYCGDGVSHTRNGTLVELFDALDVQRDSSDPRVRFVGVFLAAVH